ncbi:hypothetical protein PoB_001695200 [Plakobranchus ocellatus]|uniref:Uncharacterized protein n=1 Tax=Plakobranchus ocellatus TaxID=259542 RepID=A0AAV3Z7G6_9GAST|nr:hypothetical protein PoB_001695200 [Plakobranchus ocellatus]
MLSALRSLINAAQGISTVDQSDHGKEEPDEETGASKGPVEKCRRRKLCGTDLPPSGGYPKLQKMSDDSRHPKALLRNAAGENFVVLIRHLLAVTKLQKVCQMTADELLPHVRILTQLERQRQSLQKKAASRSWNLNGSILYQDSEDGDKLPDKYHKQRDDLKFSGPSTGQCTGGQTRTRDRRGLAGFQPPQSSGLEPATKGAFQIGLAIHRRQRLRERKEDWQRGRDVERTMYFL